MTRPFRVFAYRFSVACSLNTRLLLCGILEAGGLLFFSGIWCPPVLADTPHCGTIGTQTWASDGNVHVVTCNVIVSAGETLTIAEGAIVKLYLGTSLIVDGALRVEGTSGNPVYLTSIRDDTVGGDTNGDGGATSPAPGDWYSIAFGEYSDDSTSLIDHAVIRYAGDAYYSLGAVHLDSASPRIENSAVTDNQYCAIVADLDSFPILSGNTLTNNDANALCLTGGTVDADATWDVLDTSYYLRDTVSVANGVTLTVSQGVIVKTAPAESLVVMGALRALGTAATLVHFTSYRDDSVGGDSNGDGASTCTRGDWYNIAFGEYSDDSTSLIDHAVIRCAGDAYYSLGAVHLDSASPTIQNSTIADNQYCAIVADLDSFPILSGNTLTNNDANALCLTGGTVDADATWDVLDTSYYLRDTVSVAIGATLTATQGVIVKTAPAESLVVMGALRALGTAAAPVHFTSYRDDSVGGDSNGDGDSTCTRGDWRRIAFGEYSDDSRSLIDHAVIRCAGDAYFSLGAVHLDSASPTIQNSTIADNEFSGIKATSSTPILGCNNIYDNGSYGIYNATPAVTMVAENQWWGSTSGPYHASNPGGTGNAVTDGVDFRPWRTSLCGTAPTYKLCIPLVLRNSGY